MNQSAQQDCSYLELYNVLIEDKWEISPHSMKASIWNLDIFICLQGPFPPKIKRYTLV